MSEVDFDTKFVHNQYLLRTYHYNADLQVNLVNLHIR